jgi:hypothetical protein
VHLARNRAWRARHPGYWRRSSHPRIAHKDVSTTQVIGTIDKTGIFVRSPLQTARTLGLDPRTVAKWAARSRFEPRRSRQRPSILDAFKPRITRLLDTHPYTAQQIFQRLREEGYLGGITILRDYVRRIYPSSRLGG